MASARVHFRGKDNGGPGGLPTGPARPAAVPDAAPVMAGMGNAIGAPMLRKAAAMVAAADGLINNSSRRKTHPGAFLRRRHARVAGSRGRRE